MPNWLRALGVRASASPRYRWWVLWVALSGLLATNLLFTVFVVALPEVARGLHSSVGAMTWVVTGPMLAFGVVAPLVGKAGDLFGHRRLFLTGIAAETVAAALSALAPNAGTLITARIIAGMVGASIGAASMALVMSVFDKRDRVKALGFWSLVGAGGPVIGVAVGGPVIQLFGWRWMFFLQVPLLVIAAALAVAVLPERAAGRRHLTKDELDLDVAGALSIAACVASFLLALTFLPGHGWSSPLVLGLFALSVVCGAVFRAAERRASEPIFPLEFLRKRNFVFPILAQAFSNFAYLGAFFLTPLFLEGAFGYAHNQSAVGFLSLPRPIVFSAIAPFAGYLAVRIGERTSAVIGTSAVVLSMGVFALSGPGTGLVLVELALVLSGIGLGVASPSLSASVSNQFDPEDLGTAAASQQLMNQLGTVAGIQVMETVSEAALRGHSGTAAIVHAFHSAYLVGGALALFAVVAAANSRSTDRTSVPTVELLEAMDATERQPVVVAVATAAGELDSDGARSDREAERSERLHGPSSPHPQLQELPAEAG
jgi:EmrB/QacA subfamily drug resistance transporter